MNQARWTPLAQEDLAALEDESSQLDPDYALRVGRAALAAARFLAENPKAGPTFDDVNRKWRVRSTDHVLLYRVVSDGVGILRLQHTMRDWRPRPT